MTKRTSTPSYDDIWRRREPREVRAGGPGHYEAGTPAEHMHVNAQMEVALLGAVLIGGSETMRDVAWLPVEAFYGLAYGEVWSAMTALFARRENVDLLTVGDELARVGSSIELSQLSALANGVPNYNGALGYAHIVERLYRLRLIEDAGLKLVAMTRDPDYTGDIPALRAQALLAVRTAATLHRESHARTLAEVMDATITDLTDRMTNGTEYVTLRSGYPDLDAWMPAVEYGELILLAGRTRNGKSAAGQAIFENWARQLAPRHETCAYVTLEMSAEQQTRRMLSRHARVSSRVMRAGFKNDAGDDLDGEWSETVAWAGRLTRDLGDTVFYFDRGMSVDDLAAYVADAVETHHLRAVMVDQIDLLDEDAETESEQLAYVSERLAQIAHTYRVAILALCQLNRSSEGANWRPTLKSLRMSGRLEQDANRIWFVVRPSLYEPRPETPHWEQTLAFIVAKDRDGPTDQRVLSWEGEFTAVESWPMEWDTPNLADLEASYAPARSASDDESDGIPLAPRAASRRTAPRRKDGDA